MTTMTTNDKRIALDAQGFPVMIDGGSVSERQWGKSPSDMLMDDAARALKAGDAEKADRLLTLAGQHAERDYDRMVAGFRRVDSVRYGTDAAAGRCRCPDWRTRRRQTGQSCKHLARAGRGLYPLTDAAGRRAR